MGKYYEANPFKIHAKRKKHSYREILGVINKKNENFKIKKTKQKKPTNNDRWIKAVKTAIKHPRENKLNKQKMVENNWKLFLYEKLDFDREEILDKSLLFDLKKTSEEKVFDLILEKIPDKNDIYYIEHREGERERMHLE